MPVDSHHPDYDYASPKWSLVRKCVKGPYEVKLAKAELLPIPDPTNNTENSQRYKDYVKRAQFLGVTRRTKKAMVGMAFRNAPELELPSGLDYLEQNATGEGRSLEQLAKDVVGDLLEVGRIGLLVDYPEAEEGLTAAQVSMMNLQANINVYPTESIINWKTTVVGGESILSLIVLEEEYSVAEDEYDHDTETQYRVLKFDEGRYTVEIWREDELISITQPRQGNGQYLDAIPFVIAGSDNNNPDIDDAALYDIAEINVGHYRNSADDEESVHMHTQAMLHIDTGTADPTQWVELNGKEFRVGSEVGIVTSGGGSVNLPQAKETSAALTRMEHKEQQMVAIGARLIEPNGQAETAEAARIKHAGDNSVLTNVVQNASEAIRMAIEWCGWFMNVTGEVVFNINEDFYDKETSPQLIMAKIQLLDRGIIAKSDIRRGLRQSGQLERTDDEIDEEVGEVDPLE